MQDDKTNKHTINFTDEDIHTWLKSRFVQLIIERDHPEILIKAEELAHKYVQQENS